MDVLSGYNPSDISKLTGIAYITVWRVIRQGVPIPINLAKKLIEMGIIGLDNLLEHYYDMYNDEPEIIAHKYDDSFYRMKKGMFSVNPTYSENRAAFESFLMTDLTMKELNNTYLLRPTTIFYKPLSVRKCVLIDRAFLSFPNVTLARLRREGIGE